MKAALRRQVLAQRSALAPEDRRRMAQAVVQRLLGLPVVQAAQAVAGYVPTREELDPTPLLLDLVRRGRSVVLPRISGTDLWFHPWVPGEPMERNAFGIEEPRISGPAVPPGTLDVVLVPGVAFDRRGHRLGYGKGYYDRALAAVPRPRRVGLAYDLQLVRELPSEVHDLPVGWLVTPTQTLRFGE